MTAQDPSFNWFEFIFFQILENESNQVGAIFAVALCFILGLIVYPPRWRNRFFRGLFNRIVHLIALCVIAALCVLIIAESPESVILFGLGMVTTALYAISSSILRGVPADDRWGDVFYWIGCTIIIAILQLPMAPVAVALVVFLGLVVALWQWVYALVRVTIEQRRWPRLSEINQRYRQVSGLEMSETQEEEQLQDEEHVPEQLDPATARD